MSGPQLPAEPPLGSTDVFALILWHSNAVPVTAENWRRVHSWLTAQGQLIFWFPGSAAELAGPLTRLELELPPAGMVLLGDSPPPPGASPLGASSPGASPPGVCRWTRRDRFKVRSYQAGDEVAILRLFTPSFHHERSSEHWRWKYLGNPWGQRLISLAFSPDGRLAAQFAGYPVPFWGGGGPCRGIQVGDLMTDPQFRRVGRGTSSLIARCARHFQATHGQTHSFQFGFNTATSRAFSLRFLGALALEPVAFWRRPQALPLAPTRGYRVVAVPTCDRAWDRFFRRVAPDYGFLVERSRAYLNWRYCARPDVTYRLLTAYRWGRMVGWSVFRREGSSLVWGDALFDRRHPQAAAAVLQAAVSSPAVSSPAVSSPAPDCEQVTAWFARHPAWWAELLTRLGFEPAPEPHDLTLTFIPHGEAVRTCLKQLYYTMGDSDLF